MHKLYIVLGIVLAGLAVVLGAFGAHGLKQYVTQETVASYQTGVQYQMYHALALLFLGLLYGRIANNFISYAGLLFVTGVIFFSGSLYLIASLKAMNKEIVPAVGIITPIGGLLLIAGWVLLLIGVLKQ